MAEQWGRRFVGWADSRLDGGWTWKPESDKFEVDQRWRHIMGREAASRTPVSRASWLVLIHPEDTDAMHISFRELLCGSRIVAETELRAWHTDGFWIWLCHRAERDGQGGLRGCIQDITRRKQQEAHLHGAGELLKRAGQVAGIGGWQYDLADRRVTWTRDMFVLHGQPLDQAPTQRAALSHFSRATQDLFSQCLRKAAQARGTFDIELPMVRLNGERLLVQCVGTIDYENGRAVRLSGAMRDASERAARRVDELQHSRLELQRVNERLSLATQSGNIGIWDFSLETGKFLWDDLMYRIYGLEPQSTEISGDTWLGFLHADDREKVLAASRSSIKEGTPDHLNFRIRRPDGSLRYMYGTARVIRSADGRAIRLVGTNQDVTESRRITRRLASQHDLLRVTMRSIGDGVITTDQTGTVIWMNPMAEGLVGWSVGDARGRKVDEVFRTVNAESRTPTPNPVLECLALEQVVGLSEDTLLVSRNGDERSLEMSVAPIRDDKEDVHGSVLIFHDVTEQRSLAAEMRWRATHDSLTGLFNRSEFEVRVQQLLNSLQEDGSEHALMFLDLDRFKIINDTCGHAAGDLLLQQISQMIQGMVRPEDMLVRLGGDEFAIILHTGTVDDARTLGKAISQQLDEYRFVHQTQRFRISGSMGVVPISQDFPDVTTLLRVADEACFAAKEAGRNQIHVWTETNQAVLTRRNDTRWATRLETALDESGFELYAQRISPLDDGASPVAGERHAEILLRLTDGTDSTILPGAFMPAAERFKLVYRIDQWVLSQVIAWLARHQGQTDVGTLWINLSGQSVSNKRFQAEAIAQLTRAGQGICRSLCFEITETAAVTNLTDAASFINELRELGVRVALDDFGAGASSFGYLKSLPVDYLKIDGQFVRNIINDALDAAAVRCFAEVASVMNVRTVAEFVETAEVQEQLRGIGIDFVQGWLLHRPAPIDELRAEPTAAIA